MSVALNTVFTSLMVPPASVKVVARVSAAMVAGTSHGVPLAPVCGASATSLSLWQAVMARPRVMAAAVMSLLPRIFFICFIILTVFILCSYSMFSLFMRFILIAGLVGGLPRLNHVLLYGHVRGLRAHAL